MSVNSKYIPHLYSLVYERLWKSPSALLLQGAFTVCFENLMLIKKERVNLLILLNALRKR